MRPKHASLMSFGLRDPTSSQVSDTVVAIRHPRREAVMGDYVGVAFLEALMAVLLVFVWRSKLSLEEWLDLPVSMMLGRRVVVAVPSMCVFIICWCSAYFAASISDNDILGWVIAVVCAGSFLLVVVSLVFRPPAVLIAPSVRPDVIRRAK